MVELCIQWLLLCPFNHQHPPQYHPYVLYNSHDDDDDGDDDDDDSDSDVDGHDDDDDDDG